MVVCGGGEHRFDDLIGGEDRLDDLIGGEERFDDLIHRLFF
jgi:hypothetical protein